MSKTWRERLTEAQKNHAAAKEAARLLDLKIELATAHLDPDQDEALDAWEAAHDRAFEANNGEEIIVTARKAREALITEFSAWIDSETESPEIRDLMGMVNGGHVRARYRLVELAEKLNPLTVAN